MSAFESQWADWEPKGPTQRTDKTDKSPSVSFVSSSPRRISSLEGEETPSKSLRSLTDKTDKRYPICLPDGHVILLQVADGVPETWTRGVVNLLVASPHPDWSEAGWKTLQEDALMFLRDWAIQAHRLGWDTLDLFGVDAEASFDRLDGMGLVPLLGGRPVVALTENSAVINAASGGTLTYRRRKVWPPGCCLLWELGA